jgi:hypothetical protein
MTPLQVVEAWVQAVNARDVPAAMARTSGSVEMRGPRGASRGQPAVRDWIEKTGIRLDTERAFVRDDHVVLLQRATWRDRVGLVVAEGSMTHHFVVAGERVAFVGRYETLEDALRDTGMTVDDERSRRSG